VADAPEGTLLTGGAGADYLSGGRGNDRRETVSCGTGEDVAVVDRNDRVLGCEQAIAVIAIP
jgi:hypothetical protein